MILQQLKKSSIVKNLSILVSGTVIAQIVLLAFQLILRRVFSPSEYGAFAVYMSIVGILVTLASLRYGQTIVLPKNDQKAKTLLSLSSILALMFAILLGIVVTLLKYNIIIWLDFPEKYSWWLYLMPFSVLIFSITESLNYYLVRIKQFKLSATNKVCRRGSEGLVQVLFGFLGRGVGLLIGDFVGQCVVLFRTVFKLKDLFSLKIKLSNLWKSALEYKAFPLKNGIPSLFNTLSLLLPIIFINRLFSTEVTGYFDLARTVLILPLSLVTTSLSQILLQSFSEKKQSNKSIRGEAFTTFSLLFIVAIVFSMLFYCFGKPLFTWVFGNTNAMSGAYASIIVWAYALKFVVSPFNVSFIAFKKIGLLSLWQIIYFVLILSLLWIPFNSIEEFLYAFLFIELLSYASIALVNFAMIYRYEKKLLND